MLKTTIELHRQGDLDAAESGYRAFLTDHPNDNEALRLLGALRYQKGDRDGAITLLQRSHDAAPEQPAPLLTLGKVYFDSRQFDQARDVLSKALSLDPNQGGAHTTLGHVALAQGDTRLSPSAIETLAIVAYLQPVSRPDLAKIRGVSVDAAMNGLMERGFIEEAGRSDTGAVLFRSTAHFERAFGLSSLGALPDLAGFGPGADEVERMKEQLEKMAEARVE